MTRNLLFALVLLLSVGCQKEVIEWTDDNGPNPDGSVRFSLRTEDAETNTDRAQTKGTPRNSLEKYDTVCVNVYSHTLDYEVTTNNDIALFRAIKLKQETPDWKCTPPMYWPVGQKLSFFAYASDIPLAGAGITLSPATGVPDSITYKVPADVTKQPDLLVSAKYNQPQVGKVSLNMKHALSCVSFCGIAPEGKTYVKSITLRNVYSQGSLALNDSTITWNINKNSKGVTVFEAGILDDQELGKDPLPNNNYLMTADGYLMMIPQKLTNAAIDVLYWNGKDETGNKVLTYILPVDDASYATWKPGRKYIYKFGTQSEEDITVIYYEKYADNKYGLYNYEKGTLRNTLDNTKQLIEAGYGVLSKKWVGTVVPIRLETHSATPVTTGTAVELPDISSFLYPVSQSGSNTFELTASATPLDVYFNNSDKSCGMIVPHFAKGVYTVKALITEHAIRTPQQMRNISKLSISSVRGARTYTQELNLDFSKIAIGGSDNLTASVVDKEFNDNFDGKNKRIENVKINAAIVNGALFVSNSGEIKDVVLLNSSISSSGNTGGIAATNEAKGVIKYPRIIGENNIDKKTQIQGTSGYVGGIAGLNYGHIIGNIGIEAASELPVAEVSGWVSIKGVSQPAGGIVGENRGTITTCLLNGVYITGSNKGDVTIAKVTIEGGDYVGGIVGVNRALVEGNYSGSGATLQAEPDVAGLVSISGHNFVGGIAGQNAGSNAILNQVNVRLGRGDAANATTISGNISVGGIAGFNTEGGTLKAGTNSFISVRGNVLITGTENVGGIVGNNQTGNISNCMVYNFYSQSDPLVHYAPKITGGSNVGGIVGYAGLNTIIKDCAVFSTVSGANGTGENVTNASAQIEATSESAGGIVGRAFTGLNLATSYLLGNVKITAKNFSGGIVGQNNMGTTITSVHIGNSGSEVASVYTNLFDRVKLPVRDPRMKTNGGVMDDKSGTPTIVANEYMGGICGLNLGVIDGISIKDNVKIGTTTSNYVGGIAGGNGVDATIRNCKIYNPATGNAAVIIEGAIQVGGIVGLNNGIVDKSQLGIPGAGNSRLITIKGVSALGGIAGTCGGTLSGNANTSITDCNVYGKVLLSATGNRVGGILGENGPTNRVTGCNVIGYTSVYRGQNNFDYDITIRGTDAVGGIAGTNYGDIHGTSASLNSKVTHTAVVASDLYAGGLVGTLKSNKINTYEAKLYHCDISYGVLIYTWQTVTGAFVGQMDGVGAASDNPTLFGTASGGATNRIYTGTNNPVRINANDTRVKFPPSMADLSLIYPPNPPVNGNLWADYQLWTYLYWTAYQ